MGEMSLVALKDFTHSVGTVQAGERFRVNSDFGRELVKSGIAASEIEKGGREGFSAVIIASGPSVTEDAISKVKAWREAGEKRLVAVTNTTFRSVLWADLLYAADRVWWRTYYSEVRENFKGECWTAAEAFRYKPGVKYIETEPRPGLSRIKNIIHRGGNSGYQLIGLLVNQGIKSIVLLGFDMREREGRAHHHDEHPKPLKSNSPYSIWIPQFKDLASDASQRGIRLINATPGSALRCITPAALDDALRSA